MPIELQAKLLRVLETRRVRRLGGGNEREVDFRLLTATHRDLEAAIEEGRFRQDLYYRIAGLEVRLPRLAERVDDIPELVEHFLTPETARTGVSRRISPAVLDRLCRRPWPGNVRELANEVARLSVLTDGDLEDPSLVRAGNDLPFTDQGADQGSVPTLAELERRAILRALELADGDKRRAAEMLGISRAKVYQRLKEWRAES
jgi:DNA-binding NtrC family response regulator